MDAAGIELVAPTGLGRSFSSAATVRLGDASPGGRMRLDSLVRVLQDVSDDDARDAGFGDLTWVVRRTVIRVERFPVYLERLALSTWCAGFGAACAERRIRAEGDSGALVEAATLWVHVDPTTLAPSRIPGTFGEVFRPSSGARRVSSRRVLPPLDEATVSLGHHRDWPLRFSDFDVLGHVNNAAYWSPVEELLADHRSRRAPLLAVMEHGDPIGRGDTVALRHDDHDQGVDAWLTGPADREFAAMRIVALGDRTG